MNHSCTDCPKSQYCVTQPSKLRHSHIKDKSTGPNYIERYRFQCINYSTMVNDLLKFVYIPLLAKISLIQSYQSKVAYGYDVVQLIFGYSLHCIKYLHVYNIMHIC